MKFAIDITTGVHLGPNSINGNTYALCPECRNKIIVYSNKEVEHESCCGNCKYYPQCKIHNHPTFIQITLSVVAFCTFVYIASILN